MGLETATYISDLVATNPTSADPKSQGDDQIRVVKYTIKMSLPNIAGAMLASHTELNYVVGVTSPVQTQLNTKSAKTGDTYTGNHDFSGATSVKVPTPTLDSHAVNRGFVSSVAFSSALPGQAGNAGKFVTTDGTSASWGEAVTPNAAQTLTNKTLTDCTLDGTNLIGYKSIPQNSQSAAYTAALTDAGKHIFHPSADTTARIFTIPANSAVAFPVGAALTFVNQNGAGTVTIAITTDTMRLAGVGTTGSRTLAPNGVATAIKVTATEWVISGSGLS